MTSKTEILGTLKAARDVVNYWRAQDNPTVLHRGKERKAVSSQLMEAVNAVAAISALSSKDVEDDAKPIVLAVDAFTDRLHGWFDKIAFDAPEADPQGSQEMWAAWDAVATEIDTQGRRYRLPERLDDLFRDEVSLQQIARIYGWIDENGEPDVQKVIEERDTPGKHYDPETWVHPAYRNRVNEAKEAFKQRTPREIREQPGVPGAAPPRAVAPETVEQLIMSGALAPQIARMKGMTEEEVEAQAAELGVAIGGKFRRPPSPDERAKENEAVAQRQQEGYAKSYPDVEDVNERILACHLDDMKPGQIAELLSPDHPSLTTQKVAAIIRAAESEEKQAAGA